MMQRGVRLKREKKGKKHRMERRRKEAIFLLTAAYQAARWSDKLGGSLPEMARCTYNCHARETRQELPGQYSSNKASSCRVSSEGGPEDGIYLKPSVGIRPRRTGLLRTRAVDDVVGCPYGMGQAREKRRRQGEQCTSSRARLSPVVSGHRQDRTQGERTARVFLRGEHNEVLGACGEKQE